MEQMYLINPLLIQSAILPTHVSPVYSPPFSSERVSRRRLLALSFDVSIRVLFFFVFFLLDGYLDNNFLSWLVQTSGLTAIKASLQVLTRNSSMPDAQTHFPCF